MQRFASVPSLDPIKRSHNTWRLVSFIQQLYFMRQATLSRLRRFFRRLVLLVRPLPPVRHVATVAAVELLGNVVVTSWAATPIVGFGFMSGPHFKFVLHALSAVIIAK